MDLEHTSVVEQIIRLNWKDLDETQLQRLMYISHIAAQEFAEALRVTLDVYPDDAKLKRMAEGELHTDNLQYDDYTGPGDHSEFLAHFLQKDGYIADADLQVATDLYLEQCRELDPRTRAMTIFSREHELSSIFKAILENTHWDTASLKAFQFYLQRHIALDSDEGGHADLVDDYPIDDAVLPFYQARLNVYRVIPELFA
jgi:hypothetical protein